MRVEGDFFVGTARLEVPLDTIRDVAVSRGLEVSEIDLGCRRILDLTYRGFTFQVQAVPQVGGGEVVVVLQHNLAWLNECLIGDKSEGAVG